MSENTAVNKSDKAEERTRETRSFMQSVSRATRRRFTPEEKIRIVLEGFRRETDLTHEPVPLGRHVDNVSGQPFLITRWPQLPALSGPWLREDLAGLSLRYMQTTHHVGDSRTAT